MAYIVMGQRQDEHAGLIYQKLKERGARVFLLETHFFPTAIKFSFSPNDGGGALSFGDETVAFNEVKAVFWRNFCGVADESTRQNYCSTDDIAAKDSMACLRTWFRLSSNTLWMNSWDAFQHHKEKPLQLHLVSSLGVNIPKTYIGNNIEDIQNYFNELDKSIFKPVFGGAHTEMLTQAHIDNANLKGVLAKSPITVQEYISGTNIRTYVIGDKIISAELASDCADFREDTELAIHLIETPQHIAMQSKLIAKTLGLHWTAIDWRRNELGEYYFLEANPSPMFIGFEKRSGVPLSDYIIDCLTKNTK